MVTMNVKGITWVGNMYQKFENMCLEAEDMMYEDTVKYIENQMQAVGTTVKKFYSDIVEDLLPPFSFGIDENVDSEFSEDQLTDASGFCKKPYQVFKERHVKTEPKLKTEDSRIDRDVDNGAVHAAFVQSFSRNSIKRRNIMSRSRQNARGMDMETNHSIAENRVNKKMAATKMFDEVTSAETETCRSRTSQSCEISNKNQNKNNGTSASESASAELTRLASEVDCSEETAKASNQEKQINTSSSSSNVPFGEPVEQVQDHQELEETCVMVSGDEILFVPKSCDNLKTNKKKKMQGFSLSKKSARKQEYKELAVLHGNSEKLKGDYLENFDQTLVEDQKKSMLSGVSEPEWEIL